MFCYHSPSFVFSSLLSCCTFEAGWSLNVNCHLRTEVNELSWFIAVKDLGPDSSILAKKGLNCVLQTSNPVNFILFLCSWTNIGLVRDICYSSTCWTAWINNGSFQKQFISISCCSWGENCHLNQMELILIFEGMSKPFKNRRTKADEEQIFLFTCKYNYTYKEQPIPKLACK